MYRHILVPLDASPSDEAILTHILPLARMAGSRLTLLHVADGFQARNQERFDESPEMREDRAYLERRRKELTDQGLEVEATLALASRPMKSSPWPKRGAATSSRCQPTATAA